MRRRKIIPLLLAAAAVLSLAACGDEDKSDKKDSLTASGVRSETSAVTEKETAAVTEPVTSAPESSTPESLTAESEIDPAADGFDPQNAVRELYDAMFVSKDFDIIYELTVPDDQLEERTKSALREFDEPPEDFDYYEYEKSNFENYRQRLEESGSGYYHNILSCEKASGGELSRTVGMLLENDRWGIDKYNNYLKKYDLDRLKDYYDKGSDIYAIVVEWGFTENDGETYSEVELLFVGLHDGKPVISGTYN